MNTEGPTRIDSILHYTRDCTNDDNFYRKLSESLHELGDDDKQLIASAPALREEVKRLRYIVDSIPDEVWEEMKEWEEMKGVIE